MARCNCSPMCEKCCCGPCDCTCAAEQAKPAAECYAQAAAEFHAEQAKPVTVENAPIGTLAPAIGGGHWCRVQHGWEWNGPNGNGGTYARPGGDWSGKLTPPVAEQAQAGELPKRKESSDLAREQRERYLNSPEGLQWRQTVALERLAEKTTEQAEVLYGDDVKESGPWIRFSDHLAELAALRSRLAVGVTVDDAMVERAWMAYTHRDTLGQAYANDAKHMTREERRDMRAALVAALENGRG